MRTVRWTCPVFLLVLFLSACGGLRSLSGPTPTPRPTPTPTQSELIDQAITTVQETRRVYEGKLQQLGRQIAAGREEMSPEVLSTKPYTYGTYRQAIARFDEIETQLDLAKVVLEAKMALGDLAGADEVIKEALVLIEWTSIDGPLPTLAPGTVDEQALIDDIVRSVPTATATPVPTIRPTPVPATPVPTAAALQVHPYCDISASHVSLQDLAEGFGDSSAPGRRVWYVTIQDPHESVLVAWVWCARWDMILGDNLSLIQYTLMVDGREIDPTRLCIVQNTTSARSCECYCGRISEWTKGHHTIVMTRRHTQDVYDGWNTWVEGDYVDAFEITVKR